MFRYKFQFSLILSISYLWLLVSPIATACQCSLKQTTSSTESSSHCASATAFAETSDDCCAVQETKSCCVAESSADQSVQTTSSTCDSHQSAQESNCCVQKVDCLGCPSCNVQSVLVAAVESPKQIVAPLVAHPIEHVLFSDHLFTSTSRVDHPPDRPQLALHISTTVLRI